MGKPRSTSVSSFCSRCGGVMLPENAECPQCRPVEERELASGEENHVYALLSAANLERMRGHWDSAISKCVEALRLDPQNASAHSLVGDIYHDQGRREEAIQWFRMALDLDPGNVADQMKLDRLLKPRAIPPTPAPRTASWIRIGIPSAVTLAFLMMAVGVWALVAARQYDRSPLADSKDPPPMQLPESLRPPPRQEGFARVTEPVEETRLRRTLNTDLQTWVRRTGVRVVSATLTPGDESAVVSLLFPPQPGSLSSEGLLQTARVLAAYTYNSDRSVNRCVIRLLYASGEQNAPEIVFSGSTTRSVFHNLAPDAPPSVVAGAFESPWWNQRFFPNPPAFGASPAASQPYSPDKAPPPSSTAPAGNQLSPAAPT